MRGLAIFVLLASVVHAGPAAGPAAGTITGHVIAVQNGKELADSPPLWVWAKSTGHRHRSTDPAKLPKVQIQQKGLRFDPNVLVVPLGTKIDFPNKDVEDHNVFSPDPYFDLGRYRPGQSKEQPFDIELQDESHDEISVYCDIHNCMWARIKVVDVARPTDIARVDAKGAYAISGLTEGTYKIYAWTANSKVVVSESITIGAGGGVAKDLHLQVGPAPDQTSHKRKDQTEYPPYTCPRP
jgi:plastocyanin